MSRIAQNNGDDHAEAASKHLDDSFVLFGTGNVDGCAYLAGYVVECCIKSLILVERGAPKLHHKLAALKTEWETLRFAAIARSTSRTAKYLQATTINHPIYHGTNGWKETIRYRPRGYVSYSTAATWLEEAENVYKNTVAKMILNGDV